MNSVAAAVNRRALDALGRITSPRLSILIFHRVLARPDPLFPGQLDAAGFDALTRYVVGAYRVMALTSAVTALRRGGLPPRALAITFDDGYADNAEVALPILSRHGLVATFFVASGFLDGGRMWNDSIIETLRATTMPHVDLNEFGLGCVPTGTDEERRAAIDALLPRLKFLQPAARDVAARRVQQLSGVGALPNDLMMRTDQVRELHRAGMEIGAHTVHHPILTAIEIGECEREIADGRDRLQEIVDAPVSLMAYPNGKPGRDFDRRHVALVERLGFSGAVSTAHGVARIGDDLFQLPRFTPWGRGPAAWSARLLLNQRNTRFETV